MNLRWLGLDVDSIPFYKCTQGMLVIPLARQLCCIFVFIACCVANIQMCINFSIWSTPVTDSSVSAKTKFGHRGACAMPDKLF